MRYLATEEEWERVARAIETMALQYAVITGVFVVKQRMGWRTVIG